MTNDNLYLDVHIIQTVPVSNINRDETGTPKIAQYGGVTRARVSSQSWKAAMRKMFQSNDDIVSGTRTKQIPRLLAAEIQRQQPSLTEAEAVQMTNDFFEKFKIGIEVKNGVHQTKALFFISPGQVEKLAAYALQHAQDEIDTKELKRLLKSNQSLDLALFGRMVASDPELNVDASAQVAHALSTHAIDTEFDYYTGLDDEQPSTESGASMVGYIPYNSATLYRYANLNLNELAHNVGTDATVSGTLEYIKSFALSMPSGKQNTFANKTAPSYLLVSVRTDTPVNLVSAFEDPVDARAHGYIEPSIQRLEKEFKNTQQFLDHPALAVVVSPFETTEGEHVETLSALLTQVSDFLKEAVSHEDTDD